jgi:hypothetical protein
VGGEAFREHLERDSLTRSRGAGDQAVAIGQTEIEKLRRISLADQDAVVSFCHRLALVLDWRRAPSGWHVVAEPSSLHPYRAGLREYRRPA